LKGLVLIWLSNPEWRGRKQEAERVLVERFAERHGAFGWELRRWRSLFVRLAVAGEWVEQRFVDVELDIAPAARCFGWLGVPCSAAEALKDGHSWPEIFAALISLHILKHPLNPFFFHMGTYCLIRRQSLL